MQAIGLIAEYNPFHLGHQYQLAKIKDNHPEAMSLILMSGNSVQRGEFAFIDKWLRAEVAIKGGADLVVEAPIFQTLQSADYFARHSIGIFEQIGLSHFVFGTETATTQQMTKMARTLMEKQPEIDAALQTYINHGYAYAAAYDAAVKQVINQPLFDYNQPNHVLGFQYIKANQSLSQPMEVETIPRANRAYQRELQSGSDIRQSFIEGETFDQQAVPSQLYPENIVTTQWSDYFDLLKYRLATHTPATLREILHVREGLENRLLQVGRTAETFEELVSNLVNRRWTRSAVLRVLMAILLDIRTTEFEKAIDQFYQSPGLRILGMSQKGRQWLREYHGNCQFYSRASQYYLKTHALDVRVDAVYQLNATKKIPDQILAPIPYIE